MHTHTRTHTHTHTHTHPRTPKCKIEVNVGTKNVPELFTHYRVTGRHLVTLGP